MANRKSDADVPLSKVLEKIQEGAKEVRTAGNDLSSRITAFEEWLNKVPGRVFAQVTVSTDHDGMMTNHLAFMKDGRAWALKIYTYHVAVDEVTGEVLLRDASLDEKSRAVEHFPDLLREMAIAQTRTVELVKQRVAEFDQFAKSIGMKGGE